MISKLYYFRRRIVQFIFYCSTNFGWEWRLWYPAISKLCWGSFIEQISALKASLEFTGFGYLIEGRTSQSMSKVYQLSTTLETLPSFRFQFYFLSLSFSIEPFLYERTLIFFLYMWGRLLIVTRMAIEDARPRDVFLNWFSYTFYSAQRRKHRNINNR